MRGRVSLGYQLLPSPDLLSTSLEANYLPDEHTSLRARVGYSFKGRSTQVGASAVREFDNFTVSLDGNYGFSDKNYSVGLRFATSFGRNPQNGRFFMARPGLASMGAASMRAFQDLDGDGIYGPTDRALHAMVRPVSPTIPTSHPRFRPSSAPSRSTWISFASAGSRGGRP